MPMATQICVSTALREVPRKVLIFGFCLIHWKRNSIGQRGRRIYFGSMQVNGPAYIAPTREGVTTVNFGNTLIMVSPTGLERGARGL
jgi:hypothetical protein